MRFRYTSDAALLKTAEVTIKITEGQRDYMVELAGSGLWGNTIEAVIEELVRQELWRQIDAGCITLRRYALRTDDPKP